MRAADGIIARRGRDLIERARTHCSAASIPHLAARPCLILRALLRPRRRSIVAVAPAAADGWLDRPRRGARAGEEPRASRSWSTSGPIWCTWCKRLERGRVLDAGVPGVRRELRPAAGRHRGRRFRARRLMVDFEVESLPTTLVLSHDLIKIGELQGYLSAEPLRAEPGARDRDVRGSCCDAYDDHRRSGQDRGARPRTTAMRSRSGPDPRPTSSTRATTVRERRCSIASSSTGGGENAGRSRLEPLLLRRLAAAWGTTSTSARTRCGRGEQGGGRESTTTSWPSASTCCRSTSRATPSACAEARQAIDRFLARASAGTSWSISRVSKSEAIENGRRDAREPDVHAPRRDRSSRFCSSSRSLAPTRAGAASDRTRRASSSPPTAPRIRPATTARIAAIAEVDTGWHIQSHTPEPSTT